MSQQPTVRLVNITLLNFLARIIFYVFVFVAGWYTARVLSKEEFGQLQFVTFSAGLSWTLLSFGTPNMLSRYMTQSVVAGSRSAINTLLAYAGWSFIITLGAVGFGVSWFLGTKTLTITVELIAVFILTQFLANYFQILIQSVYHYKTAFVVTLIAVVAGGITLYLALPIWHSVAYLYSFILVNIILVVGYGLSFIKAIGKLQQQETLFDLPPKSKLARVALYFAFSAILAGILWQRTEFYLLQNWLSFTDIAVYSVAFTLIALFFEPLKLLTGVLTYYYAGIQSRDDKGEQQFNSYFRHFCWIVIFIGTYVWFNAPAIVQELYTDKYADAVVYLRWLIIGMVPGVCSYVLMSMLIGMGRSRFLFIQDLVCAVMFCVTVFFFTHWKGLEGTAIAKSISIMLSVAIGLTYTAIRIGFVIPWKLPLFSLVLGILLGYFTQSILNTSLILLALKLVVLSALYAGISYYSNMLDRSLIARVKHEVMKLLKPGSV